MTAFRRALFGLAALAVTVSGVYARSGASTVLVIPERRTLVQLGFDIASLRDATLMTYRQTADQLPRLHVWSPMLNIWQSVDPDGYVSGDALPGQVRDVVMVGAPEGRPEALLLTPAWARDFKSIESTDMMELVNGLNDTYRFTPGEWKWLAPRYRLTIKDLNEERRRYGRYGRPDQTTTTTMEAFKEPEAELVETIPAPEPAPAPVGEDPLDELPTLPDPAPAADDPLKGAPAPELNLFPATK